MLYTLYLHHKYIQNSARYVIAVYGIRGRLNRLPAGCSGDMVLASVKKVNSLLGIGTEY